MYKHAIEPAPTAKISYATIATMPKSGTVSILNFTNAYANQMLNQSSTGANDWTAEQRAFNKTSFRVLHLSSPEFRNHVSTEDYSRWEKLEYTWGIQWDMKEAYSRQPALANLTPDHRMVFLFRNPLDQLISNYHYAKPIHNASDLEDFIFNKDGLDAYIKMFYSYHVVRQKYPNNFLFVTYEELMHDRQATIRMMLKHLNIPYDAVAFNKALHDSSIEVFRQKEELQLKEDPTLVPHLRDSSIGQWQTAMTPELVQRIEDRLQEFGLSLNMFHLADNPIDPRFACISGEALNISSERSNSFRRTSMA